MPHETRIKLATLGLATIALALAEPALASSGGGGLPWESPLQQIQQSITGPVAGFIALAAVAIAGGMLIFGGELNDFARRLCFIALVGGILLGSTQIVALFGANGASIGAVDTPSATGISTPKAALRWEGEAAHG
ncbi:MAG TPA: conjugal transfer protein TrbC [Rhizobium sp.]|nr:conjugal transfer protein TrbC [Rhizobium sp.]